MKTGWLFLVVVVLAGAAWARAERLSLATYNLENYLTTDRMVDGVYRQAFPKPEAEKKALRAVIGALEADVLAVQEMGPRPYLEELQRDLAAEGHVYPYVEWMEGADPDRHLAILSKRPFVSVTKHTALTFSYFGNRETVKRGMMEVRLKTEGGELALFVVHLKSRLTERDDDPNSALRRQGEAEAAREQILHEFSEPDTARFVVLGDFNDSAASKPVKALLRRGKTTLTERVPATDSRGEVWTHFYRKEQTYSAVDHVLVSPSLLKAVVGGAAVIFDRPDVAEASDHRPVVVQLNLEKAGP